MIQRIPKQSMVVISDGKNPSPKIEYLDWTFNTETRTFHNSITKFNITEELHNKLLTKKMQCIKPICFGEMCYVNFNFKCQTCGKEISIDKI